MAFGRAYPYRAGIASDAIPHRFHWIWLGDQPLPDQYRAWMDGWLAIHPGWEHRLWTDVNRPRLTNEDVFARATLPAQRADMLRYEVVLQFGGVYLDTDFECLRNLEPLVTGTEAFGAEQEPALVGNAVFGSVAGHRWLLDVVERIPAAFEQHASVVDATGPGLVTEVTAQHPEVKIFPPEIFYPYQGHEPSRAGGPFPDAYGVHRWHGTWLAPEERFAEDFPRELERELRALIPAAGRVLTITEGIPLDLGDRVVLPFVDRDGFWGNPEDSATASAELERLGEKGFDWLVVLEVADWWHEHYGAFFAGVERRAAAVHRRRRFVAYDLSDGEGLAAAST